MKKIKMAVKMASDLKNILFLSGPNVECEMLNETYNFTSKLEEKCICLFLPIIYHKHDE